MKYTKMVILTLIICQQAFTTEINDDFSQNGWTNANDSSGKLVRRKNSLQLEMSKDNESTWIRTSKTYTIDLDQTPVLVVSVSEVSDRGLVKLLDKKTKDKKSVLSIPRQGIFSVNLKKSCRWEGKKQIEVMLYSIGNGSKITYNFLKFADKLSDADAKEMVRIRRSLNTRPPFEIIPLFNSCSYYYKTPEKQTVSVHFRKKGTQWQNALAPVWISEEGMYRGSIVGLDENTEYELKICNDDNMLASSLFKTWQTDVPIAKTIVLNEHNFKGYLGITEEGSPQGWIKYTAAPGFILRNTDDKPLIELNRAKYILLEGLTLHGGGSSVVFVKNCENVRFINCDISGWGRVGKQRFDKDGKFFTKEGHAINNDAGIYLIKSKNTVVERCYFHDPRNAANAWRYSHPAGPEGMMIAYPESTVIRYNDIIGSDQHRWNDAIEGAGNFHDDGGFNRDADIYGNFMAFGNDDGIEIDGGQQNVRVFLNKFEGFLCGVSIQGCMAGPSYVYRNLIVNMGDEFGTAGQVIKTSSYYSGKDAVSFIFNNTLTGEGMSLPLHRLFKIVAKNNIFATSRGIGGRQVCKKAETDYNLIVAGETGDEKHGIFGKKPQFENEKSGLFKPIKSCPSIGAGVAINNFALGNSIDIGAIPQNSNLILPYRPIPVTLDKYQLNFTVDDDNAVSPQHVTATVDKENVSFNYRIRQNNVFDWFTVSPTGGKLNSGKTTFTIKLIPEKMKSQAIYKGVFLIRLENGYSRPVTIYANTNVKQALKPQKDGVFTSYIEAEKPSGGKPYAIINDPVANEGKCIHVTNESPDKKRTTPAEYTFDVPKDNSYYILMRVRSDPPVGGHDSLFFAIDDEEQKAAHLRSKESWKWALAANTNARSTRLKANKLKKGKHTIRILPREPIYLDMIAITDDPKIFEHK